MDIDRFIEIFVKNYVGLLVSQNNYSRIKNFNNSLNKYEYLLVYPLDIDDEKNTIKLLVGFADTFSIHLYDDNTKIHEAQSQIKTKPVVIEVSGECRISATVAIKTELFQPIPLRKVEWSELISSPKIEDGSYSLLQSSFLEYFHLDEHAPQANGSDDFDFSHFFNNEKNKVDGLELRVVWEDMDSSQKYGTVQTLVMWNNEFIGWITCSGRYLDDHSASTVNTVKWIELMEAIYKQSGYSVGNDLRGVSVYDMSKDDVDDVAYVPSIEITQYT